MKALFLLLLLVCNVALAGIKTTVKISDSVSLGASSKSTAINLKDLKGYSIQAVITGATSPVGQIYLEASNDPTASENPSQVVNWSLLSETVIDIEDVTGTAADVFWNISNAHYKWVRLGYDSTSGSGTLNATFVGKD
jgi:hypothetical protein